MKKFYGHPDFYKIIDELKELHSKKNYQYANLENPLGNFDRVSRLCSKLLKDNINKPLAIALINMAKQVDAVYDMVGEGKTDTVENIEDKLKDIAVYAVISIILLKKEKIKKEIFFGDNLKDAVKILKRRKK